MHARIHHCLWKIVHFLILSVIAPFYASLRSIISGLRTTPSRWAFSSGIACRCSPADDPPGIKVLQDGAFAPPCMNPAKGNTLLWTCLLQFFITVSLFRQQCCCKCTFIPERVIILAEIIKLYRISTLSSIHSKKKYVSVSHRYTFPLRDTCTYRKDMVE